MHAEKEKIQAELTKLKYSKTAVDARVLVVEQALISTLAELSILSKSFQERENELRAHLSAKANLERRLSELTLSHLHKRNVTRSVSERLFHVQGNLAENVDWTYDLGLDLSEESQYLYLYHSRYAVERELAGGEHPGLSRLPSYGSAVNSRAGSPGKKAAADVGRMVEVVETPIAIAEKVAKVVAGPIEVLEEKVIELGRDFQDTPTVSAPVVAAT